MVGFGTSVTRPLYGRGPSPGLRFFCYALLAALLMYLDQRGSWGSRIRFGLLAMAYPVQTAVNSPSAAWHWLTESSRTRAQLRSENAALRARARELDLAQMRMQALQQENLELRGLRAALPPLVKRWQLAEVINVETDPLRQRLVINKGSRDGVHRNQAVLDAAGILGQVARVGPWSAEIILITDPEHALPVQIARNGLRTIAVGTGRPDRLALPYLAVNSDVKSGDELRSSGLGGVFPAGYPVARVIGVRREARQLLAQVQAEPLAHLTRAREVLLVEFDATHPAAPLVPPPVEAAAPARPAAGVPADGVLQR
ncbi:MAG: rod shape-determining protein MreC [Gammaproteobacteria bacterium]|nr:rod shape-determining protein MreC [Gammaproteobacteria bacterium]